jgi:flagellar basal-body rod protein FlgC
MSSFSGFSGILGPFAISGSALTADRLWMDVISDNIANANTTQTRNGGPYIRRMVVFEPRFDPAPKFAPMIPTETAQGLPVGVRVTEIVKDPSPPRMVYDPGNPEANAQGYVAYPNVNTVNEMVDLISATRAYEANLTVLNSTKEIDLKALNI